jgi:universal stress protein A
MIKKILIAVNDTPEAHAAAREGAALADQLHASVGLLFVVDPSIAVVPEYGINHYVIEQELKAGKDLLHRVRDTLPAWVPVELIVDERLPVDGITHVARDWQADLIVIGADHRGALAHLILGSIGEKVLREAPCPVLCVNAHVGQAKAHAAATKCDA